MVMVFGYVFSMELLHTISANQISISDFCQGTLTKNWYNEISLVNHLMYIKIICRGTNYWEYYMGTHLLVGIIYKIVRVRIENLWYLAKNSPFKQFQKKSPIILFFNPTRNVFILPIVPWCIILIYVKQLANEISISIFCQGSLTKIWNCVERFYA